MSETRKRSARVKDNQHDHRKDASLLELLKERQSKYGYISDEFITQTAQALNMPVGEVYGVATFYSFLSTKLKGKNVIRICKSVPCFLKSSELIIESLKKELETDIGKTTADGRFSLELTNCIGACDRAPAMMINHDVYGDLTPEKLAQILAIYK